MFIFLASSDLELLELLRHLCTIAKLKMQTFYLSFFSTNVLLGSIFIHMKARQFCIYGDVFYVTLWRNLQYPHNCHTWKAEISPQGNFFSTNIIRDIRDKYELCQWPSHDYPINIQWLFDDYPMTIWWLSDDYPMTIQWLSTKFWSIFLDDHWSKKIYRPKRCLSPVLHSTLDDLVYLTRMTSNASRLRTKVIIRRDEVS